jgi:Tfp pilus assembly protein PilF
LAADVDSLIQDGEAKMQAGELDSAVAVLREAVATDQVSALARLRLGGALLMKQDYSGAIEQFRETVRLDPNNANAFVGMSVAYLHSARYDLARASLDEAIRIDPEKRKEAEPLLAYIDRASARADPAPGEPHPQQ